QCAPTAPNGLHFNAVFTVAAHEAKLEHVVTLSQWLASADHPSFFTRETAFQDKRQYRFDGYWLVGCTQA
ncbi:MAG: hypothetical protein AAGB04_27585, partial [Pseudomonadota bacterium]